VILGADNDGAGGPLRFPEIWCCDFEFQGNPGNPPEPICMVAQELRSGREIRLWRDELLRLRLAPFNTGENSLFVAFFASAELGCFLQLGWPLPTNILDLYVEQRLETNGLPTIAGNGLIGALAAHDLVHIDAGEKDAMRHLILERSDWSSSEREMILEYCASDVVALVALLPRMARNIDWPRAELRGRYMAAVARIERYGVPIDAETLAKLTASWGPLTRNLIKEVDAHYGVFEEGSFRARKFDDYLFRAGIDWPRSGRGDLLLDDNTFKSRALAHPQLEDLRQLRKTLGQLRLNALAVGSDGRNRYLLSPFGTRTGRNAPSNSKGIFGPARWVRGLIKPPAGHGLAYIDWSSQEIAIAAALSGDGRLLEGYASGDPYLAFAKAAKLVPSDATKASHGVIRNRCKAVVLGVNYGMGPDALAARLGIAPVEAQDLLRLHRETYSTFWTWLEAVVNAALLTCEMRTIFGFRLNVGRDANTRQLMNWPMQANGAEMMRIAAIAATEAGIQVCTPVHDAFLICAPLEQLDGKIAEMRSIMLKAGRAVLGGIEVRTDVNVVKWPDRYQEDAGVAMWETIMRLLNRHGAEGR
jgi:DNA polymerase-1